MEGPVDALSAAFLRTSGATTHSDIGMSLLRVPEALWQRVCRPGSLCANPRAASGAIQQVLVQGREQSNDDLPLLPQLRLHRLLRQYEIPGLRRGGDRRVR